MLKTTGQGQRAEHKKAKFDVEIASVATAVPEHRTPKPRLPSAPEVFPHFARLESLYGNTGIEFDTRARRRAGIMSAMDGRRVQPSSSATRSTS